MRRIEIVPEIALAKLLARCPLAAVAAVVCDHSDLKGYQAGIVS
jgi:hypothetical protein